MLLRFSASNYLSLYREQEFSLVAGKLKTTPNALRFPVGDLKILPSAVIYGPNASGKSNLIEAISFMRRAVLRSHTQGDPEGGVPLIPFALDTAAAEQPSLFEMDFVIDAVRYQYGFTANKSLFLTEWLYAYPEGKRRKLYEREGQDITFGPSMKGQKKLLAELMRPNSLFLSTATQNGHPELSLIRNFFSELTINRSIWVADNIVNNAFSENEIDERTIRFLEDIGTGVTGYRRTESEFSALTRRVMDQFAAIMKKELSERGEDTDFPDAPDIQISIELAHRNKSGDPCFLELDRESAGTRRLLLLVNNAFRALDHGQLLIIDEIDASLHTYAAEALIALFNSPELNQKGAQLVATVHDTNLLGSNYLNRDQIWFAEKNEFGETEIYSLAEIRTRASDNLESAYLQGRYGGTIPSPYQLDFSRFQKAEQGDSSK